MSECILTWYPILRETVIRFKIHTSYFPTLSCLTFSTSKSKAQAWPLSCRGIPLYTRFTNWKTCDIWADMNGVSLNIKTHSSPQQLQERGRGSLINAALWDVGSIKWQEVITGTYALTVYAVEKEEVEAKRGMENRLLKDTSNPRSRKKRAKLRCWFCPPLLSNSLFHCSCTCPTSSTFWAISPLALSPVAFAGERKDKHTCYPLCQRM